MHERETACLSSKLLDAMLETEIIISLQFANQERQRHEMEVQI
jgi:hypothetical protein